MATSAYLSSRKKYQRPQAIIWSTAAPVLDGGLYVPAGHEVASMANNPATITAVTPSTPSAGKVKYTANNTFVVGQSVYIQGITPSGYSGIFVVETIDPTFFTVSNATTGAATISNARATNYSGEFIILSDHNRAAIDFKVDRIEKRERMINGRMRSYHIADKMTISTSWDNLPSRAFSNDPNFNSAGVATTAGRTNVVNGVSYTLDAAMYTVDGGAGGVDLLDWYERNTGSFWVFLAYDKNDNFTTNQYSHLSEYNEVIEMFISSFDYTVQKRGGSNFDFWNISVSLEEV